MANPEFKEGKNLPVEKREDFAHVPENLRDTGVKSTDARRTATPAVEHEGDHLAKPAPSDYSILQNYSIDDIAHMAGGRIEDSSTWLGMIIERFKKLVGRN